MITGQRPAACDPAETAPQAKAHIGGNHVIGFNSSSTAEGTGRASKLEVTVERVMPKTLYVTRISVKID